MNFPLIRHKNFQAWIPPDDIDEVDAKTEVLSEVKNIDFKNGYLETTISPVIQTLPSLVTTDIDNDYNLLSSRRFRHSTQGDNTVYILWEKDIKDIKIYINNTLLNLDEQNSDITFLEEPNNINYNLVNDQLKINLNSLAVYNALNDGKEETLLNLTLVYLEDVEYANDFKRDAAWYCFPRWLGWTGEHNLTESLDVSTVDENLADGVIDDSRITIGDDAVLLSGTGLLAGNINLNPVGSFIETATLNSPRFIRFKASTPSGAGQEQILTITTLDTNDAVITETDITIQPHTALITQLNIHPRYEVTIDDSIMIKTIRITKATVTSSLLEDCNIFTIEIEQGFGGFDLLGQEKIEYALVGLTGDGQRSLMTHDSTVITNAPGIKISSKVIDWRYVKYELYLEIDGIFQLIREYPLLGEAFGFTFPLWTYDGTEFLTFGGSDLSFVKTKTVTTLNRNYNLPEDVRVDNQRLIYQEVSHKGRIYFVNEDFKVYQSHILSNLAIQADSFPFDEDVGFGFFIVDQSRINQGIAVTPTNYLAVFTDAGLYVYFIQLSRTGIFKILRLTSGSIGLTSRDSVARSLTGDAATDGLFWIDYNGIYFYVGDSQPPRNLILNTHEEYWRRKSNAEKDNAVGFYNPIKREYWLQIGTEIMIYEIPYNKWKRNVFGATFMISEFVGIVDNNIYYRAGNTLVKYDVAVKKHPTFQFDTSYSTANNGSEIYDKILQELYIIFATSDAITVFMEVWVDDRLLTEIYEFSSSNRYDVFPAPLALRFNRIKFRLYTNVSDKKVRIKEFGGSYSEDNKEMLGNTAIERDVDTGYGFDYGFNYGG